MSAPSEPSSADGSSRRPRRRPPVPAGHPLARYVLRRIVVSLLLVVGVTLVTFVLTNLVPGDPVAANLGQQAAADPTIVAQFRAPLRPRQAAAGAVPDLPRATSLHGDLGESPADAPFGGRGPGGGRARHSGAGHRRDRAVDPHRRRLRCRRGRAARARWPTSALRVVSLIGISVPTFWLALVAFYVFSYRLHIAPGSGRLSPPTPRRPPSPACTRWTPCSPGSGRPSATPSPT